MLSLTLLCSITHCITHQPAWQQDSTQDGDQGHHLHCSAWAQPALGAQVLMMQCVQGSALLPQNTEESREAVRDTQIALKLAIKAAWSQEAVRRGIASAKV